jgi:hypothetical protein
MNNEETVIDPFGNEVLLPHQFCELSSFDTDMLEVYDKPSKVIEAPAMMLQVSGSSDETYYYRSIGWESILLIGTKKVEDKWQVHIVVKNPSTQQFRDIYKHGKQVNLIDGMSLKSTCF